MRRFDCQITTESACRTLLAFEFSHPADRQLSFRKQRQQNSTRTSGMLCNVSPLLPLVEGGSERVDLQAILPAVDGLIHCIVCLRICSVGQVRHLSHLVLG